MWAGRIKLYLQWHRDVESQIHSLSCKALPPGIPLQWRSVWACEEEMVTPKGDFPQAASLTGKEEGWELSLCFLAQGMK